MAMVAAAGNKAEESTAAASVEQADVISPSTLQVVVFPCIEHSSLYAIQFKNSSKGSLHWHGQALQAAE